jgi:hypothetical protein
MPSRPNASADGSRELGTLFSSLQLALISTVVGLVIRVASMWRLKIEKALLEHAGQFFDASESEIGHGEAVDG